MMFDTRFAAGFTAGFAAGFAAKLAALALAGALLAGCAAPPSAVPPPLVAPAALLLQGVPPVPQSLADSVARYTEFAGHAFVDWHPTQREMLVSHRPLGGNIAQLYRLDLPSRAQTLLTDTDQRHDLNTWLHRSSLAIISSVPLYRTAVGGRRDAVNTTLWLL